MVCGTLLAVANGFIPPFSAMIYGGLTDELMTRAGNCTPAEALLPNQMRFIPKHNITNITETGKEIPKGRGGKQPTTKVRPTIKPTTPIPVVIVGRVKELPKKPNTVKIEEIKEIEHQTVNKNEKQTVAPIVKREEHKEPETSKEDDNGETVEMEDKEKHASFNDERVDTIKTTKIPTRMIGTQANQSQILDSRNVEIADFGNMNQETVQRYTPNGGTEVETWQLGKDNRKSNTGDKYTSTDIPSTNNQPGTAVKPARKSDPQPNWIMSNIERLARRGLDGLFARFYITRESTEQDNSEEPSKIIAAWTIKQKPATQTSNENEYETLNKFVRKSNSMRDSLSVDVGEAFVPKTNIATDEASRTRVLLTQTVDKAGVNVTNISATAAKVLDTIATRDVTNTNLTSTTSANMRVVNDHVTAAARVMNATGASVANTSLANITICMTDEEVEDKMKKYAMYYLYAALATLFCAYGEIVCWSIATERGAKTKEMDLTENVLNKGPGFFDTQLHEGAVPSLGELG